MEEKKIRKLAKLLDEARLFRQEIESLTGSHAELTLDDAYRIQEALLDLRLERGERLIGYKMGLTSKAKMEQMNIHTPIFGFLMDTMRAFSVFNKSKSIHPKIEPEIAFVMKKDLGPTTNIEEAMDACAGVTSALEIIDSRYRDFKYFSLPDVVADNCSASHFVVGSELRDPKTLNLAHLSMKMRVHDEIVQEATSGSILGNPIHSLIELTQLLKKKGTHLKAGHIVLAGAATQAVALESQMLVSLDVGDLKPLEVAIR